MKTERVTIKSLRTGQRFWLNERLNVAASTVERVGIIEGCKVTLSYVSGGYRSAFTTTAQSTVTVEV